MATLKVNVRARTPHGARRPCCAAGRHCCTPAHHSRVHAIAQGHIPPRVASRGAAACPAAHVPRAPVLPKPPAHAWRRRRPACTSALPCAQPRPDPAGSHQPFPVPPSPTRAGPLQQGPAEEGRGQARAEARGEGRYRAADLPAQVRAALRPRQGDEEGCCEAREGDEEGGAREEGGAGDGPVRQAPDGVQELRLGRLRHGRQAHGLRLLRLRAQGARRGVHGPVVAPGLQGHGVHQGEEEVSAAAAAAAWSAPAAPRVAHARTRNRAPARGPRGVSAVLRVCGRGVAVGLGVPRKTGRRAWRERCCPALAPRAQPAAPPRPARPARACRAPRYIRAAPAAPERRPPPRTLTRCRAPP
mmetsp:Transcript_19692/g.67019  ORF Transcript_19692/g.67019 Transcript_19692/m.67019 type:complete len:358 (+) Transcript_19692:2-1075(+)